MKEVYYSSAGEEPAGKKMKTDNTDDYKKLISLMVGCHYAYFQPQNLISFQSKSDKNVETLIRLVGGATLNDPAEFPGGEVPLADLQNIPLGDIKRKGSKLKFQYEFVNNYYPAKQNKSIN